MTSLQEIAERVKHDLGKYATLQARWLPPDATAQERLDAARSDLLSTFRGPDGERDAASIAAPFLDALAPLSPGEADDLVAALERLTAVVDRLRSLQGAPDTESAVSTVAEATAAAESVRRTARRLATPR